MNVIVISASPNVDGLTAACATAVTEGGRQAGGEAEDVRLNEMKVAMCLGCDNGWGTCRKDHVCQVEDGFQTLHARVLAADALVLVTPVYLIPVDRWSRSYKLTAIREASRVMAAGGW
jgi:multimeric flavodoxin WrbA